MSLPGGGSAAMRCGPSDMGAGMAGQWWRGIVCACVLAIAAPAWAGEAFGITPLPQEHALRVTGSIEAGFAARVEAALMAHPETRVLIVHSRGGLLHEARQLARILNAHRVAIRAEGRCASACAVLWAATDARQLTADARLGLHRSKWLVALPRPLRALIERRNDRANVRTFLDAGFSPALASHAARTPSSSMYWVDADDLVREQVVFALQ
jgi:hypothetical protein